MTEGVCFLSIKCDQIANSEFLRLPPPASFTALIPASKSGKTSSASPASSSTQSSGVNKQLSFQISADLSPVNLDLVAAVEAGSVTVSGPVNLDLESSVEAGSVTVSVPDLPLEPMVSEQGKSDQIELPAQHSSEAPVNQGIDTAILLTEK